MKPICANLGRLERRRKEKKEAANKKRQDFCKTELGQEIKNMYKDRTQTRKTLIKTVNALKIGSNLAEMEKEMIINLIKRLR